MRINPSPSANHYCIPLSYLHKILDFFEEYPTNDAQSLAEDLLTDPDISASIDRELSLIAVPHPLMASLIGYLESRREYKAMRLLEDYRRLQPPSINSIYCHRIVQILDSSFSSNPPSDRDDYNQRIAAVASEWSLD
jgi:hypothetical protein